MAGTIIDQIWQGVIDPASNVALGKLAEILGAGLVPGTGGGAPEVSLIVLLSVALSPVFWAILILIIGYIAISGVYRTASEGKFLGNRWGAFAVPGMVVLCVILLSPIPSKSNVTIGQFVFVRGLIFGSNFADFALKKAFESNAAAATVSYNQGGEFLKQINEQAKLALPSFVCAQQLAHMGYGVRPNFFVLLNSVCKIPTDATEPFKDYYLAGNDRYIDSQHQQVQAINQAFGTNIPKITKFDPSGIIATYGNRGNSSKELMCYFQAFQQHLTNNLNAEVSSEIKAHYIPAIEKVKDLQGQPGMPTKINNRQLSIQDVQLGASWGFVLEQAYPCVMQTLAVQANETYQDNMPANQTPWRKGWVYAGQSMQDELDSYARSVSSSKLVLSSSIGTPDPSLLNDTLQDRSNSSLLDTNIKQVQQILYGPNSKIPDIADQLAAKKLMSPDQASHMTMARIAANAYLGYKTSATSNMVGAQPQRQGLTKFLDSFLGRATTASSGALATGGRATMGVMTKTAQLAFAKFNTLLVAYTKAKDFANTALNSFPGAKLFGGVAKMAATVVSTALMPSEGHMAVLAVIVTALNIIVLLPQVILMVVLLIWLTKAAIWFLIIPLATVIIALPDTRAGHDIWKSALSIMLMPLLSLLFYIVSIFINDVLYSVVLNWLFEPFINNTSLGTGTVSRIIGGTFNLILQLATGELIFRFFIAGSLIVAVTLFLSMLILKGPDLVSGALGLRGSSEDLGSDLQSIRGRLIDKHLNI